MEALGFVVGWPMVTTFHSAWLRSDFCSRDTVLKESTSPLPNLRPFGVDTRRGGGRSTAHLGIGEDASLNERIPAGQHRGAPPSETTAIVSWTLSPTLRPPRLVNVWEDKRMCGSSPTAQWKGNEMACQGPTKVRRVGKMYCHNGLVKAGKVLCEIRIN